MTEPKTKCKKCGYVDDYSNQPDGICQECGEKTIELEGYERIKQSEYKRINKYPKNYWMTARIGFNFFKKKPKNKMIKNEFSDLSAEIMENGWVVLRQEDENISISLGKYPNARFEIIEKLLEEVKK